MCLADRPKRHQLQGTAHAPVLLYLEEGSRTALRIDYEICGMPNEFFQIVLARQVCHNSSSPTFTKAATKAAVGPGPSQCGACAPTYLTNEASSLRSSTSGQSLANTSAFANVTCGACAVSATLTSVTVKEWDW